MSRSESVATVLGHHAAVTQTAMVEVLAGGQPDSYLYALVRDYPVRDGKGLRPGLLIATTEACGGSAESARSAAVALELLHNAFLVHDDIEDGSRLRRGHPTLHEQHGVPLAINAGDALAHLALEPVLADRGLTGRQAREVLTELRLAVRHSIEGQALELGWRRHRVVDLQPEDYLVLVGKKTCWYSTMAPVRIGARLGPARVDEVALSRFGFLAGAAFQIRDDLLNLDPVADTGKEPLSDIREGKRTLMLIHLLNSAGLRDRRWLLNFLTEDEVDRSAADGSRVLEMMQDAGSLRFAQDYSATLAASADVALRDAFAGVRDTPARRFIRDLLDYLTSRDH